MNKKFITSCLVTAGLIAAVPSLAKKYIESKYKVSIGEIKYTTDCYDPTLAKSSDLLICLVAKNVSIKRNNIDATAINVIITFYSPISIQGGRVNLSINQGETKSETTHASILNNITASNFQVYITKGNDKAALHNVSYSNGIAHFEDADIIYHGKHILAFDGNIIKDDKSIRISKLETDITIPFKLPKTDSNQKLTISNFYAHKESESIKADNIKIGPAEFRNVTAIKNGSDISFDSEFLTINHPWLSTEPVTFKEVVATFIKSLNKIDVALGSGLKFSDFIHLDIDLTNYHVSGAQNCNEWVSILPEPLPDALKQTIGNYSGDLSFEIQVKPKPLFTLKNKCDYACSKPPITMPPRYKCAWDTCNGLFLQENLVSYMAYDSKGNRKQRLIIKGNDANPTGAGWLPLKYIPIYVTNAFVTLEDRGFYKHNGVLDSAIQNSLIANLELGRFMRGGSTITMQLAKNLWLTREKTLLRKIHEIFLTIPLEKCLTKEQILELYLNVIEFGSNVYGIERAADYYFHCQVNQLTEEQAFYLAMILPNPKKALPPDKGGLAKAQRILRERDEYHDALASFEDEDDQ